MSTKIEHIENGIYSVNGKKVEYIDGKMYAETILTQQESKDFVKHIKSIHKKTDVKGQNNYWTAQSNYNER